MAQQLLVLGDSGVAVKDKVNENFTELYNAGIDSASILTQAGVPANTLGVIGDLYIDTQTNNFYRKEVVTVGDGGVWVLKGTFGSSGSNAQILLGTVDPTTEGNNGDTYINTTTFKLFKKADGVWSYVGCFKGADGNLWYIGNNDPTNDIGKVGDLFFQTVTNDYYIKASDNTWSKVGNLSGNVWSNGTEDPTVSTTGKNNDYYLNSTSGDFFKLISGTWTKQGNLKGPSSGGSGEDVDIVDISKVTNASFGDGVALGSIVRVDNDGYSRPLFKKITPYNYAEGWKYGIVISYTDSTHGVVQFSGLIKNASTVFAAYSYNSGFNYKHYIDATGNIVQTTPNLSDIDYSLLCIGKTLKGDLFEFNGVQRERYNGIIDKTINMTNVTWAGQVIAKQSNGTWNVYQSGNLNVDVDIMLGIYVGTNSIIEGDITSAYKYALLNGTVENTSVFTSLTEGSKVYLYNDGTVSCSKPTTSGTRYMQIGFALGSNKLYFNPTYNVLTVA
jgi:hypothetical protein